MRNAEADRKNTSITAQIRADCTAEKIHNFWNNIHFHPTDAIEDEWGRAILDRVSEDGAARYIRIYAMLEDIVSRDERGKLSYDFRDTDRRLDYLVEKGFKLLICFNFLPRAISADPECMSWLARYKGKHINTSKPGNYREWQEVCRVYTAHLLERYGEERLAQWYFHCWNEPDLPDYFLSDAPRAGRGIRKKDGESFRDNAPAGQGEIREKDGRTFPDNAPAGVDGQVRSLEKDEDPSRDNASAGVDGQARLREKDGEEDPETGAETEEERNMKLAEREYEKLYDHFAEGVAGVCSAVKIGGPSAALTNDFIEAFLRHVKAGTNWANGGTGTRFDFLSIHTYGAFPGDLAAGRRIRVEDTYRRVRELEALAVRSGIERPEIVVDEWGLSTEGFTDAEKCPVLEFRNTELYAAAYARLIDYYTRRHAPVKMQMICLSGQHNLTREFHGYRSFFTLHGFPKPIYNAYALCAKLGDRLLECDMSGSERNALPEGDRKTADGTVPGGFPESDRGTADGSVPGGFSESDRETADGSILGVFPTADETGRIAVLLYRFSPDAVAEVQNLRERKARLVHLEISGLRGKWRVRHYRIDREHSNAYTAWLRLGRKDNLNQAELEWIRREGKLKPLYPEEILETDEKWRQDIVMTDNAVSLLELEPVHPAKKSV